MDLYARWTVNRLAAEFALQGVRPVRNVEYAQHHGDVVGGPESVIALHHGSAPATDLRTLDYDIDWIVGLRCGWNARFIPTPTALMNKGYTLGQEAGWQLVHDHRTGSKLDPHGVTKIPGRVERDDGMTGRIQHGQIITSRHGGE